MTKIVSSTSILKFLLLKVQFKKKILPNITKFYSEDFEKLSSVYHCFFRRHVCLSNLKHAPSRELLLTARKTVFSHLKEITIKQLSASGL